MTVHSFNTTTRTITMHPSQSETVSVTKRETQRHVQCVVKLTNLSVHVAPTSKTVTLLNFQLGAVKVYDIDYLYGLKGLENLSLFSENQNDSIFYILPKIQNLAKLKVLNFKNRCKLSCRLRINPSVLLSTVTILNMEKTRVKEDGLKQICGLRGLTSLTLRDCFISVLPDEFCDLRYLSHLDLSNNRLSCDNLDCVLRYSKDITSLNLESCSMGKIPMIIGQMHRLTYLNLSDNSLNDKPASINSVVLLELTKLTTLILKHNRFNGFPMQIFSLLKLEYLNLEDCGLRSVPGEIVRLKKNLTVLDISHNGDLSITIDIFRFKRLVSFIFDEGWVEFE